MAFSHHAPAVVRVAVAFLVLASFLLAKADVQAVNNCPFGLTVFRQDQSPNSRTSIYLPSSQTQQLNLPIPWTGGVIWASQNGNANNGQATQFEITIGPVHDSYDVSVVNAYNLPMKFYPTSIAGGQGGGPSWCSTALCIIPDMNTVCQLENFFAGPDPGCVSAEGPGTVMTPSVQLFANQCATACALSNVPPVFTCSTGSQYDLTWCPTAHRRLLSRDFRIEILAMLDKV